jgi:hypothetical protein
MRNEAMMATHDKITTVVAATSLPAWTAPWWLPSLDHTTQAAALIYSILGIIWLGKKILSKAKPDES